MLFHVIVVFLDVHEITAITEDRDDRDGVSGVLVLEVLEDAENRRESPRKRETSRICRRSRAGKGSDIIFSF